MNKFEDHPIFSAAKYCIPLILFTIFLELPSNDNFQNINLKSPSTRN